MEHTTPVESDDEQSSQSNEEKTEQNQKKEEEEKQIQESRSKEEERINNNLCDELRGEQEKKTQELTSLMYDLEKNFRRLLELPPPSRRSTNIPGGNQSEACDNIQRADEKMVYHYKVLKRTADKMCSWEDVETLATWLEFQPQEVMRMRNDNQTLRSAAYQILTAFYDRASVPNSKRWEMIRETLCEMNKHSAVIELGIDQLIQGTVPDTLSEIRNKNQRLNNATMLERHGLMLLENEEEFRKENQTNDNTSVASSAQMRSVASSDPLSRQSRRVLRAQRRNRQRQARNRSPSNRPQEGAEAASNSTHNRSSQNVNEMVEHFGLTSQEDREEETDPKEIHKESQTPKNARLCQVCKEKDANRLFLPCAHLSSCSLCSPALTKCPQCQCNIRGIISVYLPLHR